MKSPFTGGEVTIHYEPREIVIRKVKLEVIQRFYKCIDTGTLFTDEPMDVINYELAQNTYREFAKIPFPEEITKIREKYSFSASKMAAILGFGTNVYRNYEAGEIPSESNTNLIILAKDPAFLKKLIEKNNSFSVDEIQKMIKKLDQLLESDKPKDGCENIMPIEYLTPQKDPSIFTGFRVPDLTRFAAMINVIASELKVYKTKLNKLLFYSDFIHFKKTGFSISGLSYAAIDMGPVPHFFNGIYAYLVEEKLITINEVQFDEDSYGDLFISNKNSYANESLLNPEEINTIYQVIKEFGKFKTQDLINHTHHQDAWINNFNGKGMIRYDYSYTLK